MANHRDFSAEPVTAAIRTRDGHSHSGRVLRTQADGQTFFVDVKFLTGAPSIAEGEQVVLAFTGNRINGRPTTRGIFVCDSGDGAKGTARFQVNLKKPAGKDGPSLPARTEGLDKLVERRSAERIPISGAPSVEFRLEDSTLDAHWTGILVDLSSTGLKLTVPAHADPSLIVGQRIAVRFRLEGDGELFEYGAELRARVPGRGLVAYGAEFQRIPTDAFRKLEGRLMGVLILHACKPAA